MAGNIDTDVLLETIYGKGVCCGFGAVGKKSDRTWNRGIWKRCIRNIKQMAPSIINHADVQKAKRRHYLHAEDALALGDAFFKQLYGDEIYLDMLALKYYSGVGSEEEFVTWILNKALLNKYQKTNTGPNEALERPINDKRQDHAEKIEKVEYETEYINKTSVEDDDVMKDVLVIANELQDNICRSIGNRSTNSCLKDGARTVTGQKRKVYSNKRVKRIGSSQESSVENFWRNLRPLRPKPQVEQESFSLTSVPSPPVRPKRRRSKQTRRMPDRNVGKVCAKSVSTSPRTRGRKQRGEIQRNSTDTPTPPGKPYTVEMTKNGEFGITTALSFAGYIRNNRYRFYAEVVPLEEGSKPFKCSYCSQSFGRISGLQPHVKNKHPLTNNHECTHCGMLFGMKKNLTHHIAYRHEKSYSITCHECGQVLSHKSGLRSHMRTHERNRVKTWKCNICNKMYHTNDILRNHIKKVHMKYRTCICSYCGLACASSTQLRAHLKIHEEVRQKLVCHVCAKEFLSKHSFEMHVSYFHEGKEGCKCEICGKVFAGLSLLKSHLLTHEEKKLSCTVCFLKFRNMRGLRNHSKAYKHVQDEAPPLTAKDIEALVLAPKETTGIVTSSISVSSSTSTSIMSHLQGTPPLPLQLTTETATTSTSLEPSTLVIPPKPAPFLTTPIPGPFVLSSTCLPLARPTLPNPKSTIPQPMAQSSAAMTPTATSQDVLQHFSPVKFASFAPPSHYYATHGHHENAPLDGGAPKWT